MTTATPRTPQDRKPKATPPSPAAHPEGWDLLKPFDQVPVWDQTELLEIVKPLMSDAETVDETDDAGQRQRMMTFDTRLVGTLAKRLVDFAVDKDAYLAFVSGPGALERAIRLGVAYVDLMGESERSTSS